MKRTNENRVIPRKVQILLLAFVLLVIGGWPLPVTAASNVPETVRVGLTFGKANDTLAVSCDGYLMVRSSDGRLNLTGDQSMTIQKDGSYHLMVSGQGSDLSSVQQIQSALTSAGLEAYIAYEEGYIVYIGSFPTMAQASSYLDTAKSKAPNYNYTVAPTGRLRLSFYDSTGKLKYVVNGEKDVQVVPSSGKTSVITYNGKPYRGRLDLRRMSGSDITVVNVLRMDEYLQGVVPQEISASSPKEALKAQAVAARTYAVGLHGKHAKYGFDMCNTTDCQAYGGYAKEAASSNDAVQETHGIMIYYDGQPISAVYSSTSGGRTAASEDVWSDDPVAYLRSKEDPYSRGTPFDDWTVTLTAAELSQKLNARGYPVGTVTSIAITKMAASGRPQEVVVTGSAGVKTFKKEAFRNAIGLRSNYYTISQNGQAIPPPSPTEQSAPEFYIKGSDRSGTTSDQSVPVISSSGKGITDLDGVYIKGSDSTVQSKGSKTTAGPSANADNSTVTGGTAVSGESYTFVGHGNGHGVGMSQYGVINMAKDGLGYQEILKFYYTGVEVK